ncbi:hypothetical protein Tco_0382507 [Tanacetum coccineum]
MAQDNLRSLGETTSGYGYSYENNPKTSYESTWGDSEDDDQSKKDATCLMEIESQELLTQKVDSLEGNVSKLQEEALSFSKFKKSRCILGDMSCHQKLSQDNEGLGFSKVKKTTSESRSKRIMFVKESQNGDLSDAHFKLIVPQTRFASTRGQKKNKPRPYGARHNYMWTWGYFALELWSKKQAETPMGLGTFMFQRLGMLCSLGLSKPRPRRDP